MGRDIPAVTKYFGGVVFYAIHVVSKKVGDQFFPELLVFSYIISSLIIIWGNLTTTSAFILLWLYSPCRPWPLFEFLNLYPVGRTPWTGDQPVARPLPKLKTTQTQNKRTQTSIPCLGFEPTIPGFARAKTVHGLGCAATVIGQCQHLEFYFQARINTMMALRLILVDKKQNHWQCRRSFRRSSSCKEWNCYAADSITKLNFYFAIFFAVPQFGTVSPLRGRITLLTWISKLITTWKLADVVWDIWYMLLQKASCNACLVGNTRFQSRLGSSLYRLKFVVDFLSPSRKISGHHLSSSLFIIQSFGAIWSHLLTASLNKQRLN
jgi:hypothetical protein